MNQIMKFAEATAQAATNNSASAESVAPEMIEQLRHRLVHNPVADSLDVRVAVLGELVYQCYKQLARRRYL
jgi:hypothetical protein